MVISTVCFAKVPHVLKNGDVVDAKQLNENFEYLDGNNNYVPAKLYNVRSNGNIIGTVSGVYEYGYIRVTVNKDITIGLYKDGTISGTVYYFRSSSCEGEPYVRYVLDDSKKFIFNPKYKRVYTYQESLYYYLPDANIYKFASQSYTYGYENECRDSTGDTNQTYIKMQPNDPDITGIQTYPFPTPITIDGIQEAVILD